MDVQTLDESSFINYYNIVKKGRLIETQSSNKYIVLTVQQTRNCLEISSIGGIEIYSPIDEILSCPV